MRRICLLEFLTLLGMSLAERFSFYGMRSILLVYMTSYLCQPAGALDLFPNKEAEAWVHLFVGSAYLFPILGGLLSDAFWGKYKTILYLSVIYCMGHCLLACMELSRGHQSSSVTWTYFDRYWLWRD